MGECPQTNMRGDECADCNALISERDLAQHYADEMANAIGILLNVDIGEHSNLNNPWQTALEAIEAALSRTADAKLEFERNGQDRW